MTNKRKMASALRYDHSTGQVPTVIATGYGETAERIIRRAVELGVPVHKDTELASLLVGIDLDSEIPVELYRAVAAVLALILNLNTKE